MLAVAQGVMLAQSEFDGKMRAGGTYSSLFVVCVMDVVRVLRESSFIMCVPVQGDTGNCRGLIAAREDKSGLVCEVKLDSLGKAYEGPLSAVKGEEEIMCSSYYGYGKATHAFDRAHAPCDNTTTSRYRNLTMSA